jgi:hypothetical protein
MENTTNSPEKTDEEQTKSLDSLLDQAVDGETIKGGPVGVRLFRGDGGGG